MLPQAFKSCPKCYKSHNLVTLLMWNAELSVSTHLGSIHIRQNIVKIFPVLNNFSIHPKKFFHPIFKRTWLTVKYLSHVTALCLAFNVSTLPPTRTHRWGPDAIKKITHVKLWNDSLELSDWSFPYYRCTPRQHSIILHSIFYL